MRTISADLTTVQSVRTRTAAITATVTARGLAPNQPALEWSVIESPTGTPPLYPSAGCAFHASTNQPIYRFRGSAAGIDVQTIYPDLPQMSDWSPTLGWTNLTAEVPVAMACVRAALVLARLYYVNTSGNVRYLRTFDSGSTWLSPLGAYGSGDAAADCVAAYLPNTHAANGWAYGFSTLNGSTYAAYFALTGGTNVKYADDWRAAGIYVDPDDDTYAYCLVFRPSGTAPSRLRVLRFDGATFDNAKDIDITQAGLFGLELAAFKQCNDNINDWTPLLSLETAYAGGNYVALGSVFSSGTSIQTDEGRVFPDLDTYDDRIYHCVMPAVGDYYLFDTAAVYKGTVQTATTETIRPVTYTYDEGHLELTAGAGTPDLHPGQLLTLRRTLSWNATTGYEDLIFCITRFTRRKREVVIHGVDPLGYLGITRCHRPAILNDGTEAGLTAVMRKLAARAGLPVTSDNSGIASYAVLPFTLQPSESLLGAAYRLTNQANAWLVPKNDASWYLTLITPGASDSGDYDDTAHTYPSGQWELIDAEETVDAYRYAFSYVLGTYSTDPEDGAYVAMSDGPAVANTRPVPVSYTNTRYNTDDRVDAAAVAEATRQMMLPVTAQITIPADLSLELYDVVEVTDADLGWSSQPFRVRRIKEQYDRGRLIQTLYLGEE